MNKKKYIAIILALMLALSLVACNGGASGTDGASAPPGASLSPTKAPEPTDPCPCCPECIQKDCECAKCGLSDDCKCDLPDGEDCPPLTYDIEIEIDLKDSECNFDPGCGVETFGSVTVTMNWVDNKTGYWGTAEGSGETIKNGSHELAVKFSIVPGDLSSYGFTAQLSIPSDGKAYVGVDGDYKTVLVGVDRFHTDEATYDFTAWGGGPETVPSPLQQTFLALMQSPLPTAIGTAYPDSDTGFMIFEMPLTDEPIRVMFSWAEEFSIYITLTPVN